MINRDFTKMSDNQSFKKRGNEDADNPRSKKQRTEIIEENSTLKTVILQGFRFSKISSFLRDSDGTTPEKSDSIPREISTVNHLLSEYQSAKCIYACFKYYGLSRNFAHVTFSSNEDLLKLLTIAQNHQLKIGKEILTATLFPADWALIEQLDDDSLLKIFSMLGAEDKLNVEKICKRWESLALKSWRSQKKLSGIYRDVSRERVQEYFTRGGRYIEDLRLTMIPGDGRLIMENCKNIVKLVFSAQSPLSGDIKTNEVSVMLKSLEKLKSLEITDVYPGMQYDIMSILPESMEEIRIGAEHRYPPYNSEQDVSKFEKLHTLQMTGFSMTVKGIKGLEKLKNLKHLSFKRSRPPANILSSIRGLSKLEYLSIAGSDIKDDVLIDIINNNQALEYLDISHSKTPLKDATFQIISTLPNLKTLFMKDSPNATLGRMDIMPELEQLNCRNCPRVRNQPLLQILRTSPKLSYLNVVDCKINQAFFKEAADNSSIIVEKRKLSIVTDEDVPAMYKLVLNIVRNSQDTIDDSDNNGDRGNSYGSMRRL